jgi:hypothetical protein
MTKTCANGHQIESSWTICPYCQKTGYRDGGLKATVVDGMTGRSAMPAQTAAPAAPVRKTVLLAQKHKAPLVGWLVALNGEHKGEDFRLREGQNVLGSDPGCELILRDSTISARHASFRHSDGKVFVIDLDSSNGTFLNDGAECVARTELKDNDVVRCGDIRLKFKCL